VKGEGHLPHWLTIFLSLSSELTFVRSRLEFPSAKLRKSKGLCKAFFVFPRRFLTDWEKYRGGVGKGLGKMK